MPRYDVTFEDGHTEEVFMTIAQFDKRVRKGRVRLSDGRRGTICLNVPGGHKPNNWPMDSYAMGCHTDQIAERNVLFEKHGVSARHNADGTLRLNSAKDRRAAGNLLRMKDWNGGYSDPG